MKRLILLGSLYGLLSACQKDPDLPVSFTPPPAVFKATLSNTETLFTNKIIVTSEKIAPAGNYRLTIIGEKTITADSSIRILFMVDDFTRDGVTDTKTYPLTTNFYGNFIEWKDRPNSTQGKYHFFQTGKLVIHKIGADYISGSFEFTYFTYDRYGQKLNEYTFKEGVFQNLKIKRTE